MDAVFHSILDSLNDGFYTTDKGVFTHANDAMCRIFGYTREELIGMPAWNIAAPERREKVRDIFFRMMKEKQFGSVEVTCIRKDGARGEPIESEFEYDIVRKDGQIRTIHAVSHRVIIRSEEFRQTMRRGETVRGKSTTGTGTDASSRSASRPRLSALPVSTASSRFIVTSPNKKRPTRSCKKARSSTGNSWN